MSICAVAHVVPSLPGTVTTLTPGTPGPVIVTGTAHHDEFIIRMDSANAANIQFSDDRGASFATAALAE